MIIPVYKPLGVSTHQLAMQHAQMTGRKTTHTGSLDPMADGVVVIVDGEDRFRKQELSDVPKRYLFTALVGVATDSWDQLGLISSVTTKKELENVAPDAANWKKLRKWFRELPGPHTQRIPDYSARRVAGKSAFEHARAGRPIPHKTEQVQIHQAELLGMRCVPQQQLLNQHQKNVDNVKGDFRQTEIKADWQEKLKKRRSASNTASAGWILIDGVVTVSKRTYIRSLVQDLGKHLNTPITTWKLQRTHHGDYGIKDCVCLV